MYLTKFNKFFTYYKSKVTVKQEPFMLQYISGEEKYQEIRMKDYEVVIFDLDGTLSNSKEGITKSVQYALSKLGIEENDLNNLEHFIGPPLADELIRTYGMSEEMAETGVAYYRERYVPVGLYETEIYSGVKQMLKALKSMGKYIAMATSKPQNMAEEVLRYLEIDEYFDMVMGAELHGPRQSKQLVLEALFEQLEIKDKNKYIMIGDTCFDVDGAKAVGIDVLGVSYGFGNSEEMLEHGAMAIADNTEDIIAFFK
jgi:phosphoglycolate phosphatase